jgi:hypothetical protein
MIIRASAICSRIRLGRVRRASAISLEWTNAVARRVEATMSSFHGPSLCGHPQASLEKISRASLPNV